MRYSPWLKITLLLAAIAGAELFAVEREIRREFPVEPGCDLRIDTYRGAILVEESDLAVIQIAIGLKAVAGTEAAAARLLEAAQVDLAKRDNAVTIVARNPRESGLRFTWEDKDHVDLVFRIAVPWRCNVEIKAINGSVTVGNLTGAMKAQVETGGVFFRRIEGSVDARVDFGDLIVSRCSGAVTARLLRGHMRLGTIGGPAHLTNATGDIEVMAVRSSIVAETQAGEVRVGFAPGFAGDSEVRVAGGSIVAAFHAKTACRVDVGTTWGRIDSALPLTVETGAAGKRTLVGRLNGGGPLVKLRASGGSVTLEPELALIEVGG